MKPTNFTFWAFYIFKDGLMKNLEKLKEFTELGLSEKIVEALMLKGFEKPTPIQSAVIPKILAGENDLVGQAQTGTGKTAAFGLPILEVISDNSHHVKALIMVPTRELAVQVAEEISTYKGTKKINIAPFYGGASYEGQLSKLKRGVDVVVGTPGRLIDLANRGVLNLEHVDFLVLDEADEMLNMGFKDDIEKMMSFCNVDRRTLLFSATMPPEILSLARKYMKKYDVVEVRREAVTSDLTDQIYFEVNNHDKLEALCRIIDVEKDFYGLIFCRTKNETDEVTSRLHDRGYDADCLHGDITQSNREKIYSKFKRKKITILVATDVAARGLDVNNLSHVINYSVPQDPESYVHRIGRTGRAGNNGTAITFVTPREIRSLLHIQRVSKSNIRREAIPNVKDVIQARKGWVIEQVNESIEKAKAGEVKKDYVSMATNLMATYQPEELITSLLEIAFKELLDESVYSDISDVRGGSRNSNSSYNSDSSRDRYNSRPDGAGTSRLFIAMGKKDGHTRRSIVELIKDKAKTHDKKINDVQIFENYSFITVPFQEAEIILNRFRRETRGNKPIVELAGEKGGERSGDGGNEGDSEERPRNRERSGAGFDSDRPRRSSSSEGGSGDRNRYSSRDSEKPTMRSRKKY